MSGRLHYAWVVAAVTFVALLGTAAFRSTAGVLIVPLQREFGWSRAAISAAIAVNLLLFGLVGPFAAALMERFGVRRVMVLALCGIAAGSALTLVVTAAWQLVLVWGVLIGAATGAVSVPLAALVANRWFEMRRSLVVGLLTASNATGQLVFLPVLAWLASAGGWRAAALAVAAGAAAIVPLVVVLMRDRPAEVGLRAYGATGPDEAPSPTGNPFAAALDGLAQAARVRDFWLLAGGFFVCGATTVGLVGTHLIPAAIDHGIRPVQAASLLATIGVFDIVGTTASGWLTDRYDPRRLLFAYYGLRGLSLFFLPYALDVRQAPLVAFVVVYGLDWVATVPPTVALTRQAFGPQRGTIVFGWIFASHQVGGAIAAWAAGEARTLTGDYVLAFSAAGVLALVAACLSLAIGRTGGVGQATVSPA